MEKKDALDQIKLWIDSGLVSSKDVLEMFDDGGVAGVEQRHAQIHSKQDKLSWRSVITFNKVLYLLGGLILGIGIITFIIQVWDSLGDLGQIMITFGVGVLLLFLGFNYNKYGAKMLSSVLNTIGPIIFSLGCAVLVSIIYERGWLEITEFTVFGLLLLLTTFYFILGILQRSTQLIFFFIAFAIITIYYFFMVVLFESWSLSYNTQIQIIQWLTIIIGASLLCGILPIKRTFASGLHGLFGFFGINMILFTVWFKMFDSGLWEIFFLFINLGAIALVVFIKSTLLMVVAVLHLFAYITYITSRYFADSLTWPVALIFLGCILLGLGYMTVRIHKYYIKDAGEHDTFLPKIVD